MNYVFRNDIQVTKMMNTSILPIDATNKDSLDMVIEGKNNV